ncbi:hypothetical protein J6590_105557, partial [Homalodisca vitripennis]
AGYGCMFYMGEKLSLCVMISITHNRSVAARGGTTAAILVSVSRRSFQLIYSPASERLK